jgi:predicted ABC-type transport system involved in lysophospholipase L1 biosynthesis ATPase subunit
VGGRAERCFPGCGGRRLRLHNGRFRKGKVNALLNIIGGLEKLSNEEIHIDGERVDNLSEDEMVGVRRGQDHICFSAIPSVAVAHSHGERDPAARP